MGGESTRPGSREIHPDEERSRVVPVLETLRARTDVMLSVDTRHASVAAAALQAGADIVNDVSALADGGMAPRVADHDAGLVLMHMKGTPDTMQREPRYDDVVAEVKAFLDSAVKRAEDAGVRSDAIMVDPGIGFGKTLRHNLTLLHDLAELGELDKPVLVGTSRKSFLGTLLDREPESRLMGTAASVACAIMNGARVVRVHDVSEMHDVVRVTDAIRLAGDGSPARTRTSKELVT